MTPSPQPPLSSLPAVGASLFFAAGIAVAMAACSQGCDAPLWPAATAAVIALVWLFVSRRWFRSPVMLLFMVAGYVDFIITSPHGQIPEGEHMVTADVEATRLSGRATASLTVHEIDGRSVSPFGLSVASDVPGLFTPGTRVTFKGNIQSPARCAIPDFRRNDTPFCFVTDGNITASEEAPGLSAMMTRWRVKLTDRLYLSPLSPAAKEFLAAALLGDKSALQSDTRQAFSRAGLAHILSLSGLHVSIVAGLFYLLLSPLVLVFPRHTRTVILPIAIWLYACLTGLGTPVVRAAFMTSVVLLGDIVQRRTIPLNSLCAAVLVILIFDPRQLSEAGFQLTVAAVAGIILFGRAFSPFDGSRNRLLRSVGSAFGVSIAATLASGMVAALHFHSFPLLFLGANILIVPVVVPVILACGIIVLAAVSAGMSCSLPAAVADTLVAFTGRVTDMVAGLPYATIDTRSISVLTIVLFLVFLAFTGIALWPRTRPPRLWAGASAIMAAATLVSASLTTGLTSPDPAGTWYAAPVKSSVNIIIPSGRRLFLVTDAPPTTRPYLRDHLASMLGDYMGRRGIDSLTLAPDAVAAEAFTRTGSALVVGNTRIMLLDMPAEKSPEKADIVVVTGRFRGDLIMSLKALRPSQVLLSRALHPRLIRRYADDLADAGIAYGIFPGE